MLEMRGARIYPQGRLAPAASRFAPAGFWGAGCLTGPFLPSNLWANWS
jgi:hypothetical protein